MDIKDIILYLKPQLERVETQINASLKSDISLLDGTNRSLRENGGKMIRPVLALLVGQACGQVSEDSIRFAAAAELMHNATLLHDDVVDGATERRGMPTVASMLNGPAAVLIGDFWLVRCMQTILGAEHYSEEVIRIYAKTLSDLAEGELLQMQKAASADTTQEDYLRIIFSKTASLFEASASSAAISVSAPQRIREAVTAYARNLGLAFQIRDDMFDYEADDAQVGKPVGIDLREQKITQPLLCALKPSRSGKRWRASWTIRSGWRKSTLLWSGRTACPCPGKNWIFTRPKPFLAWISFRNPRKNAILRNWPVLWPKEINRG